MVILRLIGETAYAVWRKLLEDTDLRYKYDTKNFNVKMKFTKS
jgi:hypothetical protein